MNQFKLNQPEESSPAFIRVMKWLMDNEIESVSMVGDDAEPYFTMNGCDTDDENLGNNVYECIAITTEGFEFECELSHESLCLSWYGE